MNMDQVNEIIRKHNEKLDAMTEEERAKYYAKFGLIVDQKKSKKEKHFPRIYNKAYVIERLRSGEMSLKDYHYAVQIDADCIEAEREGQMKKDWEQFEKDNKNKIQSEIEQAWETYFNEEYQYTIYPIYDFIQNVVFEAEKNGEDVVDAIAKVVSCLDTDEYIKLKSSISNNCLRSIALEFIDRKMSIHEAFLIDEEIEETSDHYKSSRSRK